MIWDVLLVGVYLYTAAQLQETRPQVKLQEHLDDAVMSKTFHSTGMLNGSFMI